MELRSNFSSFSAISCYLLLDFHVKPGTRFSLRDKRIFEISEVEILSLLYLNLRWAHMSESTFSDIAIHGLRL